MKARVTPKRVVVHSGRVVIEAIQLSLASPLEVAVRTVRAKDRHTKQVCKLAASYQHGMGKGTGS